MRSDKSENRKNDDMCRASEYHEAIHLLQGEAWERDERWGEDPPKNVIRICNGIVQEDDD